MVHTYLKLLEVDHGWLRCDYGRTERHALHKYSLQHVQPVQFHFTLATPHTHSRQCTPATDGVTRVHTRETVRQSFTLVHLMSNQLLRKSFGDKSKIISVWNTTPQASRKQRYMCPQLMKHIVTCVHDHVCTYMYPPAQETYLRTLIHTRSCMYMHGMYM